MSERFKKAISSLLICGVAVLSGCASDTGTSPGDPDAFTITSNDVFVVDEKSGLTLAGDEDSMLVFNVSGARPRIPVGAVIVGTENEGYIRRVNHVAASGARLFITASPAFLADAVVVGNVDTTIALGFRSSALRALAPGVSLSEDGLNLSGTTLFSGTVEGSSLTVLIPEGRIEFDPVVDLRASIRLRKLSMLHVVADGRLMFAGDARIVSSGPVALAREVPLASVSTTVMQRIGRVPVVITVTLSYVASLEIDLESATSCGLGIEAVSPVKFGQEYQNHEWACVVEAPGDFVARPFQYEAESPGSVRVTVAPRIDVAFYGVPGISMGLGPHFGLVERDEGFPVFAWEMSAAMRGAMTVRRGALDRRILPLDCSRSSTRGILDSGPFRTGDYIFVKQWGSEGTGPGQFGYPKGIAVDASGAVFVADNWNNRVQKFTADGDLLLAWGTAGAGDGQFNSPERIAVDEDGFVYVVDGGNNRVQKFTADGSFVAKWGDEGGGDGQFRAPVGITVSGSSVYVTDTGNNRVEMFSTNGEFLGAWGGYGAEQGRFDGPAGIAAFPEGLYVADCRNDRVQGFSPQGVYLTSWGRPGVEDGEFDCAADVAVAEGGAVLAVDLGNDRFMRFNPTGIFETKLGTAGTGEGQFDHPEAIAVDRSGNVYVVDARNRRIQRFAPRVE